MTPEETRSRAARTAAETALVRIVHHYGGRPEFVLLGGLVPDFLCASSDARHAGTTDVDVQVDLELAAGAVNGPRLERELRNAEFKPDSSRVWRWRTEVGGSPTLVRFELLTDQQDLRSGDTVLFDDCESLGAVNLMGTGYASQDVRTMPLEARVGDDRRRVELNVTGLAGYLLAKMAAARERRLPKDWYDIAFVLRHNDDGGPGAAARAILKRFPGVFTGPMRTSLLDLQANFQDPEAQGSNAYASQMRESDPSMDRDMLRADAVVAVEVPRSSGIGCA